MGNSLIVDFKEDKPPFLFKNMIYKECSINLSKKNCSDFLQAVAMSGAYITSSLSFAKGFDKKALRSCSMIFILKFLYPKDLEKFESMGFKTKDPSDKPYV